MSNKKSERNENIIALYTGVGDPAPDGSNRWSVEQLASKYSLSRVRIHQILNQYNVPKADKRREDRELEINKLSYVMDNILTEIGGRDMRSESLRDLAITYDKISNRMKTVAKSEEDALNVMGIMEEVTTLLETGGIIEAEYEVVKPAPKKPKAKTKAKKKKDSKK